MKTLLHSLALCGLAAFASTSSAQSAECSSASKTSCGAAELATAKQDCSAKKGECTASKGELASAKQECASKKGDCSGAKAELASGEVKSGCCMDPANAASPAKLASADGGECASKAAAMAHCSGAKAQLASAGDGQCRSKASQAVIPASAQLASLIQPGRVAGVVVDGKVYLGAKAQRVVEGLVREHVGTEIKAACEESRNCEKTLAMNVDKALDGKVCMKSELSALLGSGRISSLIVDDESCSGEAALASLTKITSCPNFQAECAKRAGVQLPETAAAEAAPVSIGAQLAALVKSERISGVVVDGKTYTGAEANALLASLIRENLACDIKTHCEASRACEKTLASNVEKALAGGTCAGSQLASLLEQGKVQKVLVHDTALCGKDAVGAVAKIMSCPEFQAECRMLASAPAKPECSKSKAECQASKAECATSKGLQ